MEEDAKWITGWDAIKTATGFSRGSIEKLAREYDLPLKYVCSRPVLTQKALDEWVMGMPDYVDARKK